MKNKYEQKPNLSLLLKIKAKGEDIEDRMLSDKTAYEEKLFEGKRMSDLQKHLKSLHKMKQFPDEMYWTITATQKTIGRTIPEDNSTSRHRELQFVQRLFSQMSSLTKGKYSKNKHTQLSKLNYFTISENEIEETLRDSI